MGFSAASGAAFTVSCCLGVIIGATVDGRAGVTVAAVAVGCDPTTTGGVTTIAGVAGATGATDDVVTGAATPAGASIFGETVATAGVCGNAGFATSAFGSASTCAGIRNGS